MAGTELLLESLCGIWRGVVECIHGSLRDFHLNQEVLHHPGMRRVRSVRSGFERDWILEVDTTAGDRGTPAAMQTRRKCLGK